MLFCLGPINEITSVVGGTALLPCDIVPPLPNDSVILVIWFKNEVTPIYSYDIRGKHSELASHWRDRELLQQRGYFRTITEPATLALDDVRAEDEGDFRCRVDFRRSPTRNSKVRLNVVVPPQMPTIIDERGRELPSVAGPYTEGSAMKLQCVVRGGRPKPSVSWWRGERLLPARDMPSPFPNVQKSQLLVAPLSRSDLHSVFTCQATNSALTSPSSARVSLEMHLRPLSASILTERQALSAGRRIEVDCMASGSRPAAKLSWWLDNQALVGSVDKILGEGNVTTSTVRLTPTAADNGKVLTCRAENPSLPAGVEEDTWRLDVFYAPALRLQLGSNLNPDDIEEGDDVYFECKVHANPWAYKVIWKHDGRIVQHNPKAGVLLINHDLALQGVRREQAGNYSCFASNVEGDGESNAVPLRVMYKPVCRAEQRRVYAVARLEPAKVTCEVDAYPPPDSFRWSFNHSGAGDAAVEVPEARYSGGAGAGGGGGGEEAGASSTLSYAPMTELDYGTLLCSANNAAGQQREPCVFHIIPAGRPEPPLNCSLTNQTTGSLEVECEEGFDGGLPQTFQLEVFDLESGLLAANVSSRWPRFLVEGLRAGRVLRVHAYALNAKGRSEPFALEGFTLKQAEKRTGSPVALELTPLLATLLGALAALLLVDLEMR
ncbi:hypothetical protein R5R35_002031 [Gryllus longicercus]|uniref:Nephrin n=1 Tax=Gryllus longicercus TaxID=2509291 RepID=A0AAN9VH59_9ORTH